MTDFVHLHTHTEYSLLDGLSRPEAIARKAKAWGQRAVAMTDHGNMHGAVRFYDACKKEGVKPIIGCEVYTAELEDMGNSHLVLLAMDSIGYRNLNTLVTRAGLENFHRRPRVTREMLETHSAGLICMSGCLASEVAKAIVNDDLAKAERTMAWHKDVFGDRYFVEVHDHGIPDQRKVLRHLTVLATRLDLPIVVAQDSHFIEPHDAETHELLLAVQTNAKWNDPARFKFQGKGFHFSSNEEMQAAGWPDEWLLESVNISEMCNLEITLGKQVFPRPAGVPEEVDEGAWLSDISIRGLIRKHGSISNEMQARLALEIDTIVRNEFTRYFLIVADICRWCRESGIRSSARGSVGGSLIAWALDISPVDPLRYDLSFERFLNDGRSPDIDLDFEDARRAEVLAYVQRTYGDDRVAQIVTFSEIGGRMAIRDVGRVLGVGQERIDSIAKMIPLGKSIEEAMDISPTLGSMRLEPFIKKAISLEGTVRHCGKHAAGLVIAGMPLVERTSLLRDSSGGMPMVALDMGSAERAGLVKFDMLGLKTLSTVSRALAFIKESTGELIDIDKIPEDCERTWKMLGKGDSVGVFQVESPGMRRVLRDLLPDRIEHLQAVVALYRPGPMGSIPTYCNRRHGREQVKYLHSALEPVLRGTYGLLVYQEAIMQIAQRVAGMSAYESDQFLGAVRKKNPDKLKIYEPKFRKGLERSGLNATEIDTLWSEIVPFANYGFNQAHAAAYGLLAYQTAWLKANWAKEYFAALLTQDSGDVGRMSVICYNARSSGVRVLPPCVNASGEDFSAGKHGIRFGLGGIKNVGVAAIGHIIEERKSGPFHSIENFMSRIPKKNVNKRAIEALVKSGAMDSLENRRNLLEKIGEADPGLAGRLQWERDFLGLAVTADPLSTFDFVALGRDTMLNEIEEHVALSMEHLVTVGGEIMSKKELTTKTGKPMCIYTLRDESGSLSVTAFDKALRSSEFNVGDMILIRGTANSWNGEVNLIMNRAWLAIRAAPSV